VTSPQPETPNPVLVGLAERVREAARELTADASRRDNFRHWHLSHSLVLWSVTIDRLAESGPASHRETERRFPDDPEHHLAGQDLLASHRSEVDLLAFLTVGGDLVLNDLARLFLGIDAPTNRDMPWHIWLERLDDEATHSKRKAPDPRLTHARRLDLILRAARNRVVHRLETHLESRSWDDATKAPLLHTDVLDDPNANTLAFAYLACANMELPIPLHYYADMHTLREYVLGRAGQLGGEARGWVRKALALAGFDTIAPTEIVPHVLALVHRAPTPVGRQAGDDDFWSQDLDESVVADWQQQRLSERRRFEAILERLNSDDPAVRRATLHTIETELPPDKPR
jgi:hypothetical protein